LEKDITERLLADHNDVFADIINGLIFKGEQKIRPEDLENRQVRSQYKAAGGRLHQTERDLSKQWSRHDIRLAIFGLENQTNPDRLMPFRAFCYDGDSYKDQIRKKTKPSPVLTIVLYFGKDHWNAAKSMHEILDIPEGMEDYINDYRVHVFEISWLTDEEIDRFTSDFRIVANFFANRRRNKDYVPDDPQHIEHVDEMLKLLSVFTNDDRYEMILADKEEVHNMCEVADRLVNKGIEQGRKDGRKEGLREGSIKTLFEMIKRKIITIDQAADIAGLSPEALKKEIEKVKENKV
jgi:hypothetical protein